MIKSNYIEITSYEMLNELSYNKNIKIIIVVINKGIMSLLELTDKSSKDDIKHILELRDCEKHIFIKENDYKRLCINSYKK